MKIHLISAMYSSKGHSMEYTRNFCKHLSEEFEITLYIASNMPIQEPPICKVVYTGVNYKKTEAQNFNKFGFLAPYIRGLTKQWLSYLYYRTIIGLNYIKRGDVVFIMDYDVFPLTILMNWLKQKKVKTFLWVHSAKFESKNLAYTIYKKIFKQIFQAKFGQNLNGVIVNGDYIKNQIVKTLKIPQDIVHTIQYPSAITFERIDKAKARERLGFDNEQNILLSFGILRKDKNYEFLIKSVSQAKTELVLVIAGAEGSITKSNIMYWMEKYGLKKFHLNIDYISEERISEYYSACDLLLISYEMQSGSQSGPLSLAREFELPALVSNSGEIGRYVTENEVGLVADLTQEKEFTNKIDDFFDNYEKRNHLVKQIIKSKNKYSWKSAKKKYVKIFQN